MRPYTDLHHSTRVLPETDIETRHGTARGEGAGVEVQTDGGGIKERGPGTRTTRKRNLIGKRDRLRIEWKTQSRTL